MIDLNARAHRLLTPPKNRAKFQMWGVEESQTANGGHFLNFNPSGLQGGIHLARIATVGYADFSPRRSRLGNIWVDILDVSVPKVAEVCLGLQYAGAALTQNKQYVPGSGAMRCKAGSEKLYGGFLKPMVQKSAKLVVGTLEMDELPGDEIMEGIRSYTNADSCDSIWAGVASVEKYPGMCAVAARIVEVAAHGWNERKFDLAKLRSGSGSVPICPIAQGEGMIRTNEAIAMCGEVTLRVVDIPDDELQSYADQLVSSAKDALGDRSFRQVYTDDAGGDVGKLFQSFPFAFSVAQITLISETTGKIVHAGQVNPDGLAEAWGIA